MAAIRTGTSQFCGGTVIHPRWVLTAKHCDTLTSDNVLVGTVNLNSGGRRIAITEVIDHPTLDLTLLRLAQDAGVAPAALNDGAWGLAANNAQVTVSGWGNTSEGGSGSSALLQANVSIIPTATCNARDWYNGAVTSSEMCAGVANGGIDTCQGDSGGPLWQNVGNTFQLVGVTSWGWGCAQAKRPGVYVRTSSAAGWIRERLGRYGYFELRTGTGLHPTSSNFDLEVASNGDLFAIAKSATGSGKVEVHILTAASRFQNFSAHAVTPLAPAGSNVEFAVAANRDLFVIIKSGTGTRTTEVHVLSAASNYSQFTLHTGTGLAETGSNYEFAVAENRDLFAIAKSSTGSGKTEVHVLSAASGYKHFTAHVATALAPTGTNAEFALTASRDLVLILKSGTGTQSTEVHVLTAASNYQNFSVHTGTALGETGSNFEFGIVPSTNNIVAFAKSGTATGTTEVQILQN